SAEIVNKYEELNFLYDLSQSLGALLKPGKIFNIILEKIELSLNADRSSIMLFNEKSQTLDIAAALGFDIQKVENPRVSIEKSISGYVLQNGEALMVETLQDIPPEIELKKRDDYKSQSFISVPMIVSPMKIDNNKIGVINVTEKRNREPFSSGDLKLLNSIASMAAIAIYNNQLLKKVLESERLKRDLEIAEQIQSGMLPTRFPDLPELEIFGRCIPAKNVGGDYFDFFLNDNGCLEMVMADVSGHNIGAALMMANTRSVLKSLIHASSSVNEILYRANKLLYDDMNRSGLFISVFLLRYDRSKRRLSFANGGHHPVIWYRAKQNRFVKLDADGLLLGVLPEVDFEEKTVILHPGDLLIMYTDGVIEASDASGNLFGYNRIEKLIAANFALPVRKLADKIFREVKFYSNSTDQADDITLQIMKVKR
ncbi:MAG TPA: GAF domain-containing protein, partial [Bacteroidetes bacterium]|nr:GAF domain-containing protein [Bacteroidota bacterium]